MLYGILVGYFLILLLICTRKFFLDKIKEILRNASLQQISDEKDRLSITIVLEQKRLNGFYEMNF